MARIYSNECFPMPVVLALRSLGHDVVTTMDRGLANASVPDEEVLSFAIEANRLLITLNRKDFIRLHHARPNHAGIIVCTEDLDFAAQAGRIDAELNQHGNCSGLLIRVNWE